MKVVPGTFMYTSNEWQLILSVVNAEGSTVMAEGALLRYDVDGLRLFQATFNVNSNMSLVWNWPRMVSP
jgi:hypothetical protein